MEQREAALSAQIRQMNITSNEAAQIGRETLQTLDGQDKELKQTNHQLEATGYMIDQSKRALENMTYKGWLYNKLFASDLKDPHATKASTGDSSTGHHRRHRSDGADRQGGRRRRLLHPLLHDGWLQLLDVQD